MFSSGVVVMIVCGTVLVIRGGGTLGKIKQLAKSNRISATHRERKYVCVCVCVIQITDIHFTAVEGYLRSWGVQLLMLLRQEVNSLLSFINQNKHNRSYYISK